VRLSWYVADDRDYTDRPRPRPLCRLHQEFCAFLKQR
jgi:hypothetical protein